MLRRASNSAERYQDEFPGDYLALLGAVLIAHGPTLDEVRAEVARRNCTEARWILYVDPQGRDRMTDSSRRVDVSKAR